MLIFGKTFETKTLSKHTAIYLSNSFQIFLIGHKLKQHNLLLFRLLSEVIQTVFFASIEKISLWFIVLVRNL